MNINTGFHQNWRLRKPLVAGPKGVVASHHRSAACVGADVLRKGGNAVDAAVATAFAVSVLEPWMSGIGGGGQMLVYSVKDARVTAIDCAMVAPRELNVDDYPLTEGSGGDLFNWPAVLEDRNVSGYLSMAIPGTVDGLGLAWERFGTLGWAELLAPAIDLADAGLPLNWLGTLRIATAARDLAKYPTSRAIYLDDGIPPVPPMSAALQNRPLGTLASSLRRLAAAGHRDFYEGELAARLIEDIRAGGGVLTAGDLSRYRARAREPASLGYAVCRVHAAPGLTAGPSLLGALERVDAKLPRGVEPDADTYAQWAAALADVYAHRLATMGDVDDSRDPACTTHISVADGDGNLVSLTQTLLSPFGSKVVLPLTGVLMNNGIMWFDPRPGRPNSIRPGKRPLSNMCPALVTRDERPWFALGASGGRRILPAVYQLISMLVDNGMTLEAAFHQPRIDVSGEHKATVDQRLSDDVADAIARHVAVERGEHVVYPTLFACPNAVMIDGESGNAVGMADIMSPVAGVAAA